jgi:hypothetical protein
MAKLVNLYGYPADPAAFEDYYANRHIPYATDHMPNVIGAENLRVIGASTQTAALIPRLLAGLRRHL